MDVAVMVLAQTESLLTFDAKYGPLVTTVLVTQLSVDLINTGSLCYLLRIERTGLKRCVRARRRCALLTTPRSTDGMLNKLFLWTIRKPPS